MKPAAEGSVRRRGRRSATEKTATSYRKRRRSPSVGPEASRTANRRNTLRKCAAQTVEPKHIFTFFRRLTRRFATDAGNILAHIARRIARRRPPRIGSVVRGTLPQGTRAGGTRDAGVCHRLEAATAMQAGAAHRGRKRGVGRRLAAAPADPKREAEAGLRGRWRCSRRRLRLCEGPRSRGPRGVGMRGAGGRLRAATLRDSSPGWRRGAVGAGLAGPGLGVIVRAVRFCPTRGDMQSDAHGGVALRFLALSSPELVKGVLALGVFVLRDARRRRTARAHAAGGTRTLCGARLVLLRGVRCRLVLRRRVGVAPRQTRCLGLQ